MDRHTDSITFMASVRPETRARTLDARDINVRFYIPRALMSAGAVKPQYQAAVEELKTLFIDKLALPHVRDYGHRVTHSGHGDWPHAQHLPLTPAAAARTQSTTPRAPATPSRSAGAGPSSAPPKTSQDDVFVSLPGARPPRAGMLFAASSTSTLSQPAVHTPALCDACMADADDDAQARLLDAHTTADQFKGVSLWTRKVVKPTLPTVLACQAWQPGNAERIVNALIEAGDDGHAIYATLLSLDVCSMHAFEIAAAVTHDLRHGLQIVGVHG